MFTGIVVAFLLQLFGPDPGIVVSEDSTVITSPLGDDGLPDYQKHWRDLGREGVTFENNAAVLYWQAIWPGELRPQDQLPVSQALGFDRIPSPTNTLQDPLSRTVRELVGLWLTARYQEGLAPEDADRLLNVGNQATITHEIADEVLDRAMSRPWRSADVPPLADWIARSEEPFGLLHEATTRPKWWSPSPSLLGDNYEGAIMIMLPGVQSLRSAARALNVRAMWLTGEGRRDEAWRDLKASFQFATFCGKGFTLVEQLVAIAIDNITLNRTVTLLQHGEPDAKFAREVLDYLNARKLPCDVVNSFDKGERVFYADTVVMLASDPDSARALGLDGPAEALDVLSTVRLDWNIVLRTGNNWYDRLVESARVPSRAQRKAAIQKYEEDLTQVAQSVKNPRRLFASVLSSEARSAVMADVMISLMLPALNAAMNAEERAQAMLDLTRVAAALAVYRAEQGEYPEKLSQLVPGMLPEVPNDLYADKPFHYERMPDEGYLLYSMFENGTDDGGTDYGGYIVGGEWVAKRNEDISNSTSDLVIRVPIPKFELPAKPEFAN